MVAVSIPEQLTSWFTLNARNLPWRRNRVTAWQILVSEIMLQQTPAARVAPQWEAWIKRWPDAQTLAAASPADVLRQWDKLGYPNRALRLRETAIIVSRDFNGKLPTSESELRALPGIGEYTAAAILAFAYKKRSFVLDTNVRRVIARVFTGAELATGSISSIERELADRITPIDDKDASLWSAAVMEFGALVCTARNPACNECLVRDSCAWRNNGYPLAEKRPATQKFVGTDRQVRGKLMAVLRDAQSSVAKSTLDAVWADSQQRERALDSLVTDGLVDVTRAGRYRLPN